MLKLAGTDVADLSPLARLEALRDLNFIRAPACAAEPELQRLAEITDDEERTRRTLEWLRGRAAVAGKRLPPPRATRLMVEHLPKQDEVLEVRPEGDRLEVVPGHPTPDDAADPLRRKLHFRLLDVVRELANKAGNTHHRLATRAQRLRGALDRDLEAVDLVDVYLEIDELRIDLKQDNSARAAL